MRRRRKDESGFALLFVFVLAAMVAISVAPAYAYSTFTLASLTSFSTGARAPGVFGTLITMTSRSVT